MNYVRRFAPISGDRSHRLELVAAYFALNGIVVLGSLLIELAYALFSRPSSGRTVLAPDPFELLLSLLGAATACVALLVGWQLLQRRRGAAVTASILFAIPLLGWVMGAAVGGVTLVVNVIGLLLIRSAWGELEPGTWWPRRQRPAA